MPPEQKAILEDFIKRTLERGVSEQTIKKKLLARAWPEEWVDEVLQEQLEEELAEVPMPDFWRQPTWPVPSQAWARALERRGSQNLVTREGAVGSKVGEGGKTPKSVEARSLKVTGTKKTAAAGLIKTQSEEVGLKTGAGDPITKWSSLKEATRKPGGVPAINKTKLPTVSPPPVPSPTVSLVSGNQLLKKKLALQKRLPDNEERTLLKKIAAIKKKEQEFKKKRDQAFLVGYLLLLALGFSLLWQIFVIK